MKTILPAAVMACLVGGGVHAADGTTGSGVDVKAIVDYSTSVGELTYRNNKYLLNVDLMTVPPGKHVVTGKLDIFYVNADWVVCELRLMTGAQTHKVVDQFSPVPDAVKKHQTINGVIDNTSTAPQTLRMSCEAFTQYYLHDVNMHVTKASTVTIVTP